MDGQRDPDTQSGTNSADDHSPAAKELPATSSELLRAAQTVRDLEFLKRKTPISSPAFHVLADRIQKAARRVFQLAGRQERIGNEAPPEGSSIDDVEADLR
ncbi:MAG TPA: hypothetical protein VFV72_05840 [Candidatus Limnocylindrales bacterium]|nr:hypothetical protein [Candidatus Limnocylindrales bacterium]